MDATAKAGPVSWSWVFWLGGMAVAGSQTSKKASSLAAEEDSALSGLEGVALFCLRLELAAIDHAGRNG